MSQGDSAQTVQSLDDLLQNQVFVGRVNKGACTSPLRSLVNYFHHGTKTKTTLYESPYLTQNYPKDSPLELHVQHAEQSKHKSTIPRRGDSKNVPLVPNTTSSSPSETVNIYSCTDTVLSKHPPGSCQCKQQKLQRKTKSATNHREPDELYDHRPKSFHLGHAIALTVATMNTSSIMSPFQKGNLDATQNSPAPAASSRYPHAAEQTLRETPQHLLAPPSLE